MRSFFCLFITLWITSLSLPAQNQALQSGPMLGYSTMREVMVWVQTSQAAEVKIKYFEKGKPEKYQFSESVLTEKKTAFIAKLIAETEPGLAYEYQVYLNGKALKFAYPLEFQSQSLWQWRTDPPEFEFALGSCNFVNEDPYERPGKPYGGQYEIFESIYQQNPDFMLWTGDNTYLREVDWNSRSGIIKRYTHTRSLPEMQPLLASTHHYAIWDDHDYGPDNSDRSFWLKEESLDIFKMFWANPNYGVGGGISGSFHWNDCQFFLLDNRYFRSPNNYRGEDKDFLGKEQLDWLLNALISSRAAFKFVVVGGQVLNPFGAPWSEGYSKFSKEHAHFLEVLNQHDIRGLVFLDGDRHHTELSKLIRENNYPLYDLTVSPLTAGGHGERGEAEDNIFRVKDTYYGKRNFAMLKVSGPRQDRVLQIRVLDVEGQEIWKKEIRAQDLRKK